MKKILIFVLIGFVSLNIIGCKKEEKSKEIIVTEIVDESTKNKDFQCAEALEGIYNDNINDYYLPCIKSKYILVKYSDGTKENIKDALKKGKIKITDLDSYGITYYKYPIEEINELSITVMPSDKDERTYILDINDEQKLYYYGIDSVKVKINNQEYDLKDALDTNKITFDKIFSVLDFVDSMNDGGSKLYKSNPNKYSDLNNNFNVLECHTLNGNRDIYVGRFNLSFGNDVCRD